MLSPVDCMSSDGTICKCISIARYGCLDVGIAQTSTVKDDFDYIVPDISTTSHMRWNKFNFEDDYVTYNDIFVLWETILKFLS